LREQQCSTSPVPTKGEKKALWFLAIVMLSGSAVRLCRSAAPSSAAADASALETQLARVDSVRALDHTRTKKRGQSRANLPQQRDSVEPEALPLVDLDRASEAEIEALPGIGPALAHRIVSFRDSLGAFGDIAALCAVSGIGPALTKKLRPLVTFTGPRRPVSDECGAASKSHRASPGSRGVKLR
jgi:competence protein ComEA